MGQAEKQGQNETDRTGQAEQNRTCRTILPGQNNCQKMAARTGQLGQEKQSSFALILIQN
jgi:hypothetical protein